MVCDTSVMTPLGIAWAAAGPRWPIEAVARTKVTAANKASTARAVNRPSDVNADWASLGHEADGNCCLVLRSDTRDEGSLSVRSTLIQVGWSAQVVRSGTVVEW